MDNLLLAQILQGQDNLCSHVLSQYVVKRTLPLQEIQEAALGAVLDKQIKLVMTLERLVELDNRGVIKAGKDASFDKDFLNPSFVEEARDEHFLQAIVAAGSFEVWIASLLESLILELHLQDCSVGSIADFCPCRKICPDQHFLFVLNFGSCGGYCTRSASHSLRLFLDWL